MIEKSTFKIKIISIILIILVTVIIAGVFSYKGLKEIILNVSQSSKPEIKLGILKQILSDNLDAESSIKSYNLTHNSKYLIPFYKSALTNDENIENLKLMVADNKEQKILLERMISVMDEKYEVLNELLSLHTDENIIKELTKLSNKIETKKLLLKNDTESTKQVLKEDKRNFFQKIFGKKNKAKQNSDSLLQLSKKNKALNNTNQIQHTIKDEIEKVNKKHLEELKIRKDEEFNLTSKNEALMNEIRSIVSGIENIEKKIIALKIEKASLEAKKTTLLVGIFCIAACLLLLVVSFVIFNYIQKNNSYERALKEAKNQAEMMAHSKEIFLANMSHEIRTPLNAIMGFTQQVLQSDLNNEQREQLNIIKKSTDHLLHIVNDILDYSKIQSGKFNFESIHFNPNEILTEVITLSSPFLKNKKVKLTYDVDESDTILKGDPGRLKQIMLNLLSNAIKFTEKGDIHTSIQLEKIDPESFLLCLIVRDTGIGIPQNKIKEVFQEFQQASDYTFFKYGGTGLGLPITKKLIELQDGTIEIKSKEGAGTEITVQIPYVAGILGKINTKEEFALDPTLLNNVKALIADDNDYNRKLLYTILKKWNMLVKEVSNGKEAVNEVINNQYDIVLMDARMPEMSGIEASQKIRSLNDPIKSKTPIIALTAVTSPEKIQNCKEAGMNDFISKPFKEEDLFNSIHSLISGSQISGSTKNSLKKPDILPDNIEGQFNLNELLDLCNGNKEFYVEMLGVFIQTIQDSINGMEKAMKEGNYKEVAGYAHKIAPSCLHMGSNHLFSLVKNIEEDIRKFKQTTKIEELVNKAKQEVGHIITALEIEIKKEKIT
jgi:signal transduction histidine kinase/DNA-binding NarL/FixJ family response regulator/HPt (histidine-containing phosphotransfer) domain-containing protein